MLRFITWGNWSAGAPKS